MKTITLTDEAYQRLKDWKGASESFSSVVIRIVPKRGTLSDLSVEIDKLSPLTDAQAALMSDAVAWANDWKNYRDPWTTSQTPDSSSAAGEEGRPARKKPSSRATRTPRS